MDMIRITDLHDERLQMYTECSEVQLKRYYEPDGGVFVAETALVISRALEAGCRPVSFLIEEKRYEDGLADELLKMCAPARRDNGLEKAGMHGMYEECKIVEIPKNEAGMHGISEECKLTEIPETDAGKPKEAVRTAGTKDTGAGDIPVYVAPLEVINRLTGYNLTRGVLCAMKRPVLPVPADILKKSRRVCILEDVMNPTNVGAIFRSAAALGIDAVILTYGSSDPLYRRAARVSMGTVFSLPFTFFAKDDDYMAILKSEGYATVSMALKDNAVPVSAPQLKAHERLAVIFGTESTGIKEATLDASDHIAIIPMQKGVDSLNVAAASAVTFWELCSKDGG